MTDTRTPGPESDRRAPGGVVLVSENFPPDVGGTPTLFWNVYTRLSRDNPVVVLTDTGRDLPRDEDLQGLQIIRTPGKPANWSVFPSRRYYLRRAREIERIARRDSVVHAGCALPEGLAAFVAHVRRRIPYILWVHGEELATARTSRELLWLSKRVYRAADGVLANSHNTAALVQAFGVPPGRISVAYPGVDPDVFSPSVDGSAVRRRYAPCGEHLVLSVGRLQKRKGHDISIDAFARIVRGQPEVRYVIVGDGEERGALETRVRAHGLADHVVFAGLVDADDLPKYYAACDVFLMPNRMEAGDFEGFGIVFIEAAASGKPAIGGATGGAPEAIDSGKTGLLVSGTDADELATVLHRLLLSPGLCRDLGRAARERVLRHFTWDNTTGVVANLHRRVSETRGGRQRRRVGGSDNSGVGGAA